ncbi:MAG: hypothetical protein KZQ65_02385, partial [Candidatus Thiodiazotropha sp. (ex Gloverina cf. vestifex)]|nr:hypothetical protein [Candidatus Thiodiazotropha sp. (ex Gloverina cf. vestifex)]
FASWGLYNDWPRMCTIIPQSMDSFRASLGSRSGGFHHRRPRVATSGCRLRSSFAGDEEGVTYRPVCMSM